MHIEMNGNKEKPQGNVTITGKGMPPTMDKFLKKELFKYGFGDNPQAKILGSIEGVESSNDVFLVWNLQKEKEPLSFLNGIATLRPSKVIIIIPNVRNIRNKGDWDSKDNYYSWSAASLKNLLMEAFPSYPTQAYTFDKKQYVLGIASEEALKQLKQKSTKKIGDYAETFYKFRDKMGRVQRDASRVIYGT